MRHPPKPAWVLIRPRMLLKGLDRRSALLFWLVLTTFMLAFGWMAWAGNRAFMPILRDTDLAMWHSVMKQFLQGELPSVRNPFSGTFTHYFAADHFNPLLFLVLPFWVLLPSNVLFAWVQIAVYAGAAVFLFAIARLRGLPQGWAAVLAGALLLSPMPTWSLYNHFSSSPFLILFLLWAVWALLRGATGWYWVAIGGLLLSREDAALLAMTVGLYAILARRRYGIGGLTVLLAAAYFVVVIYVVMPALAGGLPYPYTALGYGWLGPTPSAAVRRLLTEPLWVIQQLADRGAIRGLLLHLLPFAFTSLVSWRGLLFLLPLSYLLLYDLDYHHAYWVATLAGLAAVEGVLLLRRGLPLRLAGLSGDALLAGIVALSAVGTHVQAAYSPVARAFKWSEFTAGPKERAMREALAMIPAGSRVTASRIYLTHLAPTHEVECVWEHVEVRRGSEPAGLWCRDWDRPVESEFLLLVDPGDTPEIRQILAGEQYGAVFAHPGVALLQQGHPTAQNRALADQVFRVRQARELPREVGELIVDDLAGAGLAVEAPEGRSGLALYGWYRWVCPGPHQVTLWARAGPGADDLGRLEVVSEAGTTTVATRALRGPDLPGDRYEAVRLPFVITEKREIEVRVRTTGRATLWLEAVSLEPLDTRPRSLVPPEDPPC